MPAAASPSCCLLPAAAGEDVAGDSAPALLLSNANRLLLLLPGAPPAGLTCPLLLAARCCRCAPPSFRLIRVSRLGSGACRPQYRWWLGTCKVQQQQQQQPQLCAGVNFNAVGQRGTPNRWLAVSCMPARLAKRQALVAPAAPRARCKLGRAGTAGRAGRWRGCSAPGSPPPPRSGTLHTGGEGEKRGMTGGMRHGRPRPPLPLLATPTHLRFPRSSPPPRHPPCSSSRAACAAATCAQGAPWRRPPSTSSSAAP